MYKMLGRFSELKDEEARYAYADTVNNAFLRAQIEQLRKERGFSQEKLAELVGTKQSGISRWLNSGFSTCKVESLRKFAKAYGVRLRISLEEFGTLPSDVEGFTKDRLTPRKFEDDPAFKEPAAKEPEPEEVLVEVVGNPVVLPPPITGLGLGSVDQEGLQQVRAAAMNHDWLIDYLRGGPNTDSPGLGAVDNPPSQPPPPQRIPDRYNGFSLVPARQGTVPRQQQGPELNRGAIVPHPCGSSEGDGVIGTNRKLPYRPRPRDARRKKRA